MICPENGLRIPVPSPQKERRTERGPREGKTPAGCILYTVLRGTFQSRRKILITIR